MTTKKNNENEETGLVTPGSNTYIPGEKIVLQ
jgi:hypothetical protein